RAGTAPPTWRSARCLRYEDRRSRVRDASRVRRRGDPRRRPWPLARGRRERRGRARERARRRHAAHRAAPLESVMPSARVAVLGAEALHAAVLALGFEPCDTSPEALVVDLRDAAAVRRAAAMTGVPRVFVGGDVERPLVAALGLDASFVAGIEPARLGPALVRILPTRTRAATRMMVVTGARGGVGLTLLATKVARRIAKQRRVWLLDATGSGAAALPSESDDVWLIGSQCARSRVGERNVFRALPRDEPAVAAAISGRAAVRGALGRAYDDLSELLLIDTS